MSDIADDADRQSEALLNAAIKTRRPEAPAATGKCLYCEEPVGDGRRWCDPECRDQWEHYSKRK